MTWTKWLIVCSVGLCFQQVLGQQGMNFEIIFDSEGAKTADSFQMPVGPPPTAKDITMLKVLERTIT